MIRPTAYCDQCGRPRAEANNWFRAVSFRPGAFAIVRWEEQPIWREEDGREQHLCSESCAVKAMARAVGSGSIDESEQE